MNWMDFLRNKEKTFLLIILILFLPVPFYFVIFSGLFPLAHLLPFLFLAGAKDYIVVLVFGILFIIVYLIVYLQLYKFIINKIYKISDSVIRRIVIYLLAIILIIGSFFPIYSSGSPGGSMNYSILFPIKYLINLATNGSLCIYDRQPFGTDRCYRDIAETKNNFKICEKINDSIEKERCNTVLARKAADISMCDKGNSDWADECYMDFAKRNNNDKLCDKMKNSNRKDDCFWQIAVTYSREDMCDKIINTKMVPMCKEIVEGDRKKIFN